MLIAAFRHCRGRGGAEAWGAVGAAGVAQSSALPLAGLEALLSPLLPVTFSSLWRCDGTYATVLPPRLCPCPQWVQVSLAGRKVAATELSLHSHGTCRRWRWAHAVHPQALGPGLMVLQRHRII